MSLFLYPLFNPMWLRSLLLSLTLFPCGSLPPSLQSCSSPPPSLQSHVVVLSPSLHSHVALHPPHFNPLYVDVPYPSLHFSPMKLSPLTSVTWCSPPPSLQSHVVGCLPPSIQSHAALPHPPFSHVALQPPHFSLMWLSPRPPSLKSHVDVHLPHFNVVVPSPSQRTNSLLCNICSCFWLSCIRSVSDLGCGRGKDYCIFVLT